MLCRLNCCEKGESVNHIVCDRKKLAQREYKQRYDNVIKAVHWKLCEKCHLEKKDKWYEHGPDSVSENNEVKLLWDVNTRCDHVIEARRLDIVVVNKQERKCSIIDIAVLADKIGEKENEKVEKYQDLANCKTVEHENCSGGTNCCRIIGKCNKKLGQVAGKVGCQNWYFIIPQN